MNIHTTFILYKMCLTDFEGLSSANKVVCIYKLVPKECFCLHCHTNIWMCLFNMSLNVSFVTMNIQELGNMNKRKDVLKYLKGENIIFISYKIHIVLTRKWIIFVHSRVILIISTVYQGWMGWHYQFIITFTLYLKTVPLIKMAIYLCIKYYII